MPVNNSLLFGTTGVCYLLSGISLTLLNGKGVGESRLWGGLQIYTNEKGCQAGKGHERGLTLDKGGGSSLFPKVETAEVPKKVVRGRPSKDLLIGYYFLLISF